MIQKVNKQFKIDSDLARRFQQYCYEKVEYENDVIEKLIQDFLDKQEKFIEPNCPSI